MTGVSGVKSRKLWEVMDTITVTNHADIGCRGGEYKWWNSLPRIRGHIRDAAKVAQENVRDAVSRSRPMLMPLPRPMECKSWAFRRRAGC